MPRLAGFLLLALLMAPLSASAVCCEGAAVAAIESAGASITARIVAMQAAVILQLKTNAADQNATTLALQKAVTKSLDALTAEQEMFNQEIAKRSAQYDTERELDRLYGLSDALAQVVCDDAATGLSAKAVQANAKADVTNARKSLLTAWLPADAGRAPPSAVSARVTVFAKMPDDDLDVTKLYDGAFTGDNYRILKSALVDPEPPPSVSSKALSTPAGLIYQAQNKDRFLRQTAAAEVVDEVIRRLRKPEGANASEMDMIDNGINKTGFLSTEYKQSLQTANTTDLLRQSVTQAMMSNYLLVVRYNKTLRTAMLHASASAQRVDQRSRAKLAEAVTKSSQN